MFSIGAFAIIFDECERVLLCHRRDLNLWNLPGGGVESGELPNEAVVREVEEETGLEVVIERLVGVYGKVYKRDELVFSFVCRVVGGELMLTDEADECKYFAINDIPVDTIPKHVERIFDALAAPGKDDAQPIFRREFSVSTKEWTQQLKSS